MIPRLSRRLFLGLLCLFPLLTFPLSAGSPQKIKLLTIGNSFSRNATHFLPGMAVAGHKDLLLLRADIGGCSLERHARHLAEAEADPEGGRAYKGTLPGEDKVRNFNLIEALRSEKWDIITIQQLSNDSFKPETYEPHAAALVAAIRKYAPDAEIVVHQTWAWQADAPLLKQQQLTAEEMFQRLRDAYAQLAKTYELRILPVGEAFEAARKEPRWQYQPDPNFDYGNPPAEGLPRGSHGLIVGWYRRDGKLTLDYKHANTAGQYLGAAVFYQFLFGEPAPKLDPVPEGLTAEDLESLHRAAAAVFKAPAAAAP